MSQLKVGAGRAIITPAEDLLPIKSKFSDWGRPPQNTEAVYDDLHVRAIVIDNGTDKSVIMTWELQGYPGCPGLLEDLSAKYDIPSENFLIIGTHNHSGAKDLVSPGQKLSDEDREYYEKYWEIERKGAFEAMDAAISTMRPAKYGYGETQSYLNVNRDVNTPMGYWIEGKNLGGFSDRTLAIVKFVDMEDKLICAFTNYPMHNTCLHMMKDFDGKGKISGNICGVACSFVEQHYGEDVVIAWGSGTAGNQNPLLSHNLQYEYPDGYSASIPLPDGVGFMLMEYSGRYFGTDIVKGIDNITTYSEYMPMQHISKPCYLPAQKRADGKPKGLPIRMGGYNYRTDDIPYGSPPPVPELPKMVDDPSREIEVGMSLHIFGDIAMIGLNAEPYAEIGVQMKEASPLRKTIIITHTGDRNKSGGYIMDKASIERGSKVFQAFGYIKAGACEGPLIENELKLFDMALKARTGGDKNV